MNELKVTGEMLKTKSDLELLNIEIQTTLTSIETNLDNITTNWKGKKATIFLEPVEGIKAFNKEIIEKITAKAEEIGKAYNLYLKNSETEITQSSASTVLPGVTSSPTVTPIPTPSPSFTTDDLRGNNVTDMRTGGNYSRVITYQGAKWDYFNMRDPKWANWQFDRNSQGFKELARNGTHPFATINILTNSGLLAGKQEDIVLDVLGVSGKQTKIDGRTVGDTTLNLTTGPVKMGNGHKYKTILAGANIKSTAIESLDGAINELKNGNIVHCIAQNGSSLAKNGHYLNLMGYEENNSGQVTGIIVMDSLGRSQAEYDAISNNNGTIKVIEPGLVRIDASKEGLSKARLSSFRTIDGGQSQTKTVFSYEEYLKTQN